MSSAQLKERKDQIQSLIKAAEQAGGGNSEKKSYTDERFWKPTVDKAGNGYAVIRFLPAPKSEELPWIRYWDHGFKGPTGLWYIENSLTSIGQTDPVGELNSRLWNSGIEADKDLKTASLDSTPITSKPTSQRVIANVRPTKPKPITQTVFLFSI